jgi:hypothetical protein
MGFIVADEWPARDRECMASSEGFYKVDCLSKVSSRQNYCRLSARKAVALVRPPVHFFVFRLYKQQSSSDNRVDLEMEHAGAFLSLR